MLGACVGAGSFGGAGCVVRGIIVVLEMGGGCLVWFGGDDDGVGGGDNDGEIMR